MLRCVPARSWLALALLLLAPTAARAAVDLAGTWFVLVHYRDSATANPDEDRWDDKVWTIEQSGSRMKWTEYPIVVFNDGTGRFGRVGRNPNARLMHKWEPNEAQQLEVQQGLQVNSRGSKTKTLAGSAQRGWRSSSASRSTSAFTVGYQETWSIESPDTLPVFTRDDALGAESSLASKDETVLSGRTRYRTLEVSADGNVLTGEYTRDESKKGTFRLTRGGAARGIESDGRTPNQKAQERFQEQVRDAVRSAAYTGFLQKLGDEKVRALRGQLGEEGLFRIYEKYEKRLIGGDQAAVSELADELASRYSEEVAKDLNEALRASPDAALGDAAAASADADVAALLSDVRAQVGEEELASMQAKYGERVRAGDDAARAALSAEVREAYDAALAEELARRIREGDSEALRQLQQMRDEGSGAPE